MPVRRITKSRLGYDMHLHSGPMHERISAKIGVFLKINFKTTCLPSRHSRCLEQNFQEVAMENRVERAVGEKVGLEHRSEGLSEARKEWLAPELRKVEIAE